MSQKIQNAIIELGGKYFEENILELLLTEVENTLTRGRDTIEFFFLNQSQIENSLQLVLGIFTKTSVFSYRLDTAGLDKNILPYDSICGINERIELNSVTLEIYGKSNLTIKYQIFGPEGYEIIKEISELIQNKIL